MTGGALDGVWDRLANAREVRFRARWEDGSGDTRRGSGHGSVTVEEEEGDLPGLRVREEGVWEPGRGRELRFLNRYRWTRGADGLGLEHLRRGAGRPVFLVELVSDGDGGLVSREPHLCGEDRYRARVRLVEGGVSLSWRILGPKKRQRLESVYR